MRFPTIEEVFETAGCVAFGHQWEHVTRRRTEDVYRCAECGATERKPR